MIAYSAGLMYTSQKLISDLERKNAEAALALDKIDVLLTDKAGDSFRSSLKGILDRIYY
jgi:hypothetical protein